MSCNFVKKAWYWLISEGSKNRKEKTEIEKLQMSARATAKCRFNAAARLRGQNKFAFFTTIILSLGLILIPLIQNSGIKLYFDPRVMNMMSIFLAVAILVYSIVIGTAHYELREANLNECGYRLKEFIRELGLIKEQLDNGKNNFDLSRYHNKYSEILAKSPENHLNCDYDFARLDMHRDYIITGIPRLLLWLKAHMMNKRSYILPIFMMILELFFILDMVGFTSIFTPYLQIKSEVIK
ncbi:hypothetical protein B0187_04635 [Haemophilus paracuniculus]|uniref:SMODS and SLOG-associating 2TM effector domain-containing protein n=1 Tax=Haemophilus paracuniculus TaxID=734 RepID=A0A1T0AT80_9PAST|nr:SLATT domain-containing protein [Haemophilus paracuniculus]OOR99603.1 hypothetical protein B0187_04635 [Haemophilus paracuniculus]